LTKIAIHNINKKVKVDVVAAATTYVKEDCCGSVSNLATAQRVSCSTKNNILHDDVGLVQKSAMWLRILLNHDQSGSGSQVTLSSPFLASQKALLDRIMGMDETMISWRRARLAPSMQETTQLDKRDVPCFLL
jgi:hypothetical protein